MNNSSGEVLRVPGRVNYIVYAELDLFTQSVYNHESEGCQARVFLMGDFGKQNKHAQEQSYAVTTCEQATYVIVEQWLVASIVIGGTKSVKCIDHLDQHMVALGREEVNWFVGWCVG